MKKSNKPTKGNANKSNGGNNGDSPRSTEIKTTHNLLAHYERNIRVREVLFRREGCFECLKGPPVSTRYEPGKGIEWLEDIPPCPQYFSD